MSYWTPLRDTSRRFWQRVAERRAAEERDRAQWISDLKLRYGIICAGDLTCLDSRAARRPVPHPVGSDSMSSGPAPELMHLDLPVRPGARLTIRHSPGDTEFSPPDDLTLGYTISVNGVLWRATFKSSSIGPDGAFLELEIEGRYGQVSQA